MYSVSTEMDKNSAIVAAELQVKSADANAQDQFLTVNLPLSVCRALGSRIRPGGFVCVKRVRRNGAQATDSHEVLLAHAELDAAALAEHEKLQSSANSVATPRKADAVSQQATASSKKKKAKSARDEAELDDFFETLKADDAKASGRKTPHKPKAAASAPKQQAPASAQKPSSQSNELTVSATSAAAAAFGLTHGQQLELHTIPEHRIPFWRSVVISPSGALCSRTGVVYM